jgi:hypothetical protein
MPGGGTRKTKGNKDCKDSEVSEDLSSSQPPVSQIPNPGAGAVSDATMENPQSPSLSTSKSEIAKAIRDAFKDPEVLVCIQQAMKPIITAHVAETLKPFQEKIEDLDDDLTSVRESLTDYRHKIDTKCNNQDKRIRELERLTKSRNLRITGLVPQQGQTNKDRYSPSLDNVLTEAGINDISSADVEEFITINIPAPDGNNQTVLLKFGSEAKRDRLYSQRTKLKNCTARYYINEDLTKGDSLIFKRTRKEVKDGTLHSCWTRNGQVWAKASDSGKPFVVTE